jgi:hypothetical protein
MPDASVGRSATTAPEAHGAGAERIARAAWHPKAALQLAELPPKLGLTRDHLLWRIPVRPLLLVFDGRNARPAEALTPDATHALQLIVSKLIARQ